MIKGITDYECTKLERAWPRDETGAFIEPEKKHYYLFIFFLNRIPKRLRARILTPSLFEASGRPLTAKITKILYILKKSQLNHILLINKNNKKNIFFSGERA